MFARSIVAASRCTDRFFSFPEAFVSVGKQSERSEVVRSHCDCTLVPLRRLFSLSGAGAGPGVEIGRLERFRIQLHRHLEFFFRVVESAAERKCESSRCVRFGKLGCQLDGPAARRFRASKVGRSRVAVLVEKRAAIRDSAVSECVSWIELDRALEHLPSELMRAAAMLMEELPTPQVNLVRLHIRRGYLLDRLLFVFGQHYTQGGDNARCNLILDGENILQLAVITLGPELSVVAGIHELRGEPESLTRFAHASLEHSSNLKLPSDFANVLVLVLESEGRSPRRDLERLDLRKCVDDFLGHPVGERFPLRVGAQIAEWKSGDRPSASGCTGSERTSVRCREMLCNKCTGKVHR